VHLKKNFFIVLLLLLIVVLVSIVTGIISDITASNSQSNSLQSTILTGVTSGITASNSQLNSSQSNISSSYQDIQWGLNVQKHMNVLKTDSDKITYDVNNNDYTTLAVDAQNEIKDTQNAIDENDQFNVSFKFQEPKKEWRSALQDYNSAGKILLRGANEAKIGRVQYGIFLKAEALSSIGTAHLTNVSEALGINLPLK
jgi:hypothetical protein